MTKPEQGSVWGCPSVKQWLPSCAILSATLVMFVFVQDRSKLVSEHRIAPLSLEPIPPSVCRARKHACCSKFNDFISPRYFPQPAKLRTTEDGKRCFSLLLIIVFNYGFYGHLSLLHHLYKDVFAKVVFYGPEEDAKGRVRAVPRAKNGVFMHIIITQATIEFPGYDGYIWMADDQVINYNRLLNTADPRKIWMERYKGAVPIFHNRPDWLWMASHALPAVRRNHHCLPEIYFNRSELHFGCRNCVTFTMADFGYLPARFVSPFRELAYSLREVHLEISIPTILHIIAESPNDIDHLRGLKWLWSKKRRDPLIYLTTTTQVLHPVKIGRNPVLAGRLLDFMKDIAHSYKPPDWLKC